MDPRQFGLGKLFGGLDRATKQLFKEAIDAFEAAERAHEAGDLTLRNQKIDEAQRAYRTAEKKAGKKSQ